MTVQSLFQSKREQFVDANGKPIVSGKLYIGAVNTDPTIGGNQIPVYPSRADAIAGTNALAQPLLTDSYGRTDESVWVTTSYAYVLTDSADVQLLTEPYIEVVDVAQEIQDAIDAAFSTLEQAYVNLFANGSMVVGSGNPVTLTGSFLEGKVTRTYGRALNVSAGTMEQGADDEFGSTGWNASFLGVTCPNTSDYIEFRIPIYSQDAIRMANRAAMFSALVDHNVGTSIDYTITFAVADAIDDFSSVTVVETSGDLPVANEAATRIEFTTDDMGDCSNGVAITIRANSGQITAKNFRFTEIQPEVGDARTAFQTLGYDVVKAAVYLDDPNYGKWLQVDSFDSVADPGSSLSMDNVPDEYQGAGLYAIGDSGNAEIYSILPVIDIDQSTVYANIVPVTLGGANLSYNRVDYNGTTKEFSVTTYNYTGATPSGTSTPISGVLYKLIIPKGGE